MAQGPEAPPFPALRLPCFLSYAFTSPGHRMHAAQHLITGSRGLSGLKCQRGTGSSRTPTVVWRVVPSDLPRCWRLYPPPSHLPLPSPPARPATYPHPPPLTPPLPLRPGTLPAVVSEPKPTPCSVHPSPTAPSENFKAIQRSLRQMIRVPCSPRVGREQGRTLRTPFI